MKNIMEQIKQAAFEDELRKIAEDNVEPTIGEAPEEEPAPPFNPVPTKPISGIKTINKV